MNRRKYIISTISIIAAFVFTGFFSCAENPQNADSILVVDLLPASGAITGWDRSGSPGVAQTNDQLYSLINGASELYLQHGFVEGVLQDYDGTIGGEAANLGLFISDQSSPADVEALFDETEVVPTGLTPWDLGDEAYIDETLPFHITIHVRADRFYTRVTVEKNNAEEEAKSIAQGFAQTVVAEIQ
ncbi:hypothetical protein CEE37_11935 [candidate division LCP-89 bacterium B3_LCP]|uniref:Uncharacterized protein n=1 Tax=candidate division LCP-89 bacterium B3_LCP TaxID=2012998 RepID=A0A532UW45_UNCL8|nr:MAG: hypothetical protein CEE37_11935 [candidate division LCP-89 bacterium B3_LCP]